MFVALPTIVQAMLLQYLSNRPHSEVDGFVQMLRSCPPGSPTQPTQQGPMQAEPATNQASTGPASMGQTD